MAFVSTCQRITGCGCYLPALFPLRPYRPTADSGRWARGAFGPTRFGMMHYNRFLPTFRNRLAWRHCNRFLPTFPILQPSRHSEASPEAVGISIRTSVPSRHTDRLTTTLTVMPSRHAERSRRRSVSISVCPLLFVGYTEIKHRYARFTSLQSVSSPCFADLGLSSLRSISVSSFLLGKACKRALLSLRASVATSRLRPPSR